MRPMHILLAAWVTVSTLACDKIPFLGGGEDPAIVARAFWAAIAQNDIEGAAQHAVVLDEANSVSITYAPDAALTNMVVADADVDGDIATSRTTMHIANAQMQADLDFVTTMKKIDSEWKVDQNATLGAMADNAAQQILGVTATDMAGAMEDAMTQAAEGIGHAMQTAAETLVEGMNDPGRGVGQRRTDRSDAVEIPWNPEMVGTIDPGMTREQVVGIWGEPVTERFTGDHGYMFYRNGCEIECGLFDTVLLERNQVVDAVLRGAGHGYSGISSSPPGREPEETLPESAG